MTWLWTTGNGGRSTPPSTSTGLYWSVSRASRSSVSTSLRNGPHTMPFPPQEIWKHLAWPLSSTAAPLRASWLAASPLGVRPQGATEDSAYDPVHHWGWASCYPRPLYQAVSGIEVAQLWFFNAVTDFIGGPKKGRCGFSYICNNDNLKQYWMNKNTNLI